MKQRQKPGSILAVDNEVDFLDLVRVIFAETYEVYGATNVDDALRMLRQGRADVVLLDIHMPYRSGWDVLRALAQQPAAPPVIVITGDGRAQVRIQAEELGAVHTIIKPIGPRRLRRIVEHCMTARQASRAGVFPMAAAKLALAEM